MTDAEPEAPPVNAMVEADPSLEQKLEVLTDFFSRVHFEQMFGLPVCNNALNVEAVDFQRLQDGWAGVIITPWFMKYFYLPEGPDPWAHHDIGARVKFAFPAGELACFVDRVEGLGSYVSYSLYSPMPNFKTQADARATAKDAVRLLFEPPPQPDAEDAAPPDPEPVEADAPASGKRRAMLRTIIGRGRTREEP